MLRADTVRDDILAAAAADPERVYGLVASLDFRRDGTTRIAAGCPIHHGTGKTPSFKVTLVGEYAGHWACHGAADCGGGDILAFAQKIWGGTFPEVKERLADMIGVAAPAAQQAPATVVQTTRYAIRNLAGELQAEHVRKDLSDGTKDIGWFRAGKWSLGGIKPGTLPLYNTQLLADLPGNMDVIVCEGEKAADALTARGYLALGTYGTGADPEPEVLKCLVGYRVTLWPDADENGKGQAHMNTTAGRLCALGVTARIVAWQDPPKNGADAADWTGTAEELRDLLSAAQPWTKATGAEVAAAQAVSDLGQLGAEIVRRAAEHPVDPEYILGPIRARVAEIERFLLDGKPVESVRASELMADLVDTRWYWEQWLACGYLHIFAGSPEVGKSAMALYVAGSVMGMVPYPRDADGQRVDGTVCWYDTEGAHKLALTRMRAWGFDATRFVLPGKREALESLRIDRPDEVDRIQRRAVKEGAALVVIDSLRTAHESNSNDEQVGRLLRNVAVVAQDLDVPIIVLHHPRKLAMLEAPAVTLDRLAGSGTIGAMARVVWGAWKETPDDAIGTLAVIKSNLDKKPDSIGYSQTDHAFVEWCEPPEKKGYAAKYQDCAVWLQEKLRGGSRPSDEILREGEPLGYTGTIIRNARHKMGLWQGVRDGVNHWGLPSGQ